MVSTKPFPLPESMTIASVAELKPLLTAHLRGRGPLVLNAGAVTRADAAGLQLLLAFARAAKAAERPFSIAEPSSALCETAARLDLTKSLGLDAPQEV